MLRNKKSLVTLGILGISSVMFLGACSSSDVVGDTAPLAGTGQSTADLISPREFESTNGTLDVSLTAAESQVPYNGTTRWAMTYNGAINGPTLRVHPGDTVTIHLINKLREPTSLHTHGLHVSPSGKSDNPFTMVEAGKTYTYQYKIPTDQHAGTFWYHPHTHGLTAEQVSAGLSGAIIVEDSVDSKLAQSTTDRVLLVTDPAITSKNPSASNSSNSSMNGMDMGNMDMGNMNMGAAGVDMMTQMRGRTGPQLLTNGMNGMTFSKSGGKVERAHIVNATTSTRLRFTFTGKEMFQLATAGGRLSAARQVTEVELAPGERSEVVLIPSSAGGALNAQRLSNEGNGGPMGSPETIATVSPDAGTSFATLPAHLATDHRNLFAKKVKVARTRMISLIGHMNPTIDGKPFDPSTVNFTAKKGTVEEWVIKNTTPMRHPIHLHTWGFQIQGTPGWQDIVDVPAHSTQVIRVAFDDFTGKTVIHCHILDHEDTGMMAVIKVV